VTPDKKGPHDSSHVTRHSSLLLVGIVGRPHGLSGELSVEILSSFPDRFFPGLSVTWTRGSELRQLRVRTVRPHGRRLLLSFEGFEGIDAARALVDGELGVAQADAFPISKDSYYSHELAGLPCFNQQGILLGHAVRLEQNPGGPLLEIDTPRRSGLLVPFVEGIVVAIDREAGRIVLDPPEGLLDL
jgi:16S rRNA processing protein RimM